MTIHVNIGEAKARLSELVAAVLRGEDIVLDRAGEPKVRLVALPEALAAEREARARKRRAAIGCLAEKYADYQPEAFDIPASMTDSEYEARIKRKFG